MADPEELDVEAFIEEVRKMPMLWDVMDEEYQHRTKKRDAWLAICRVFCDGFDIQSEEYQNDVCEKLKKKWKNLKDNFIKQKKKKMASGSDSGGRSYMYFKQLSFLRKSHTRIVFRSKDTKLEQKNKEDLLKPTENPKTRKELDPPTRTEDPPTRAEDHQIIAFVPINNFKNFSRPTVVPNYGKSLLRPDTKKRKLDQDPPPTVDSVMILQDSVKTVKQEHSSSTAEPNPDRMFFESILPYMASFTEDQKLEFRCEVLNTIKRIRTSHQNGLPLEDSAQMNDGYSETSNEQQMSSPYTSYDLPS